MYMVCGYSRLAEVTPFPIIPLCPSPRLTCLQQQRPSARVAAVTMSLVACAMLSLMCLVSSPVSPSHLCPASL